MDASDAAQAELMVAAPEVGIPLETAKEAAKHAPTILMVPLVILSILFIIIGIAVYSANKTTPGSMLMVLGLLLGGGAFMVMVKSEGKTKEA